MKLRILFSAAICMLLAFRFAPSHVQEDFKLVQTSKEVSLYEKWYEISPGKKARELKATVKIKATLQDVVKMIHNESKGKDWNSNAARFEIKDKTGSGWVNYIEYDLPWPMDNQDCVLKYSQSDMGSVLSLLTFSSTTHSAYPEKDNISRIPNVKGKWILTHSGEHTQVEYYITTTPSETLPRAVTDPIVRNNLINTIASFRDLLQ